MIVSNEMLVKTIASAVIHSSTNLATETIFSNSLAEGFSEALPLMGAAIGRGVSFESASCRCEQGESEVFHLWFILKYKIQIGISGL